MSNDRVITHWKGQEAVMDYQPISCLEGLPPCQNSRQPSWTSNWESSDKKLSVAHYHQRHQRRTIWMTHKILPYDVVPLHHVEFLRDAFVIFFVVSPNSLMLPFAGLLLNVFLPRQLVLQQPQSCLSAMRLADRWRVKAWNVLGLTAASLSQTWNKKTTHVEEIWCIIIAAYKHKYSCDICQYDSSDYED